MSSPSLPCTAPIPPEALLRRRDIQIDLAPDPETCQAIAQTLGLIDLRNLRLNGVVRPQGARDWDLTARLRATAKQACVVSLKPVTARIDEPVHRRFVADWSDAAPGEHRMPDDDTREPLGRGIDPGAILVEALSLALPDYPRAEGVTAAPGPDADPQGPTHRPFAGLKDRLGK